MNESRDESRADVRSGEGPDNATSVTNNVSRTLEAAAKAGAVVLGLLYVLGLLVSNSHAMQLGIADFGGLQARYVAVGSLFCLYVLLIASVLVVPVLVLAIFARVTPFGPRQPSQNLHPKSRVRTSLRWAAGVSLALFFAVTLAWFVGDVVGYLSPTGKQWVPGMSYVYQPRVSFAQLADAYAYPSIVVGGLNLYGVFGALAMWNAFKSVAVRRFAWGVSAACSVSALSLLLFGYAANAYPNMRYNLGGGSPQVWEIQLDARLASRVRMLGLTVTSTDSVTVMAGPIAVWHQSDRFIYVTQLGLSPPVLARAVRAIAIDDVRGFRVLPMSVHLNRDRTLLTSAHR